MQLLIKRLTHAAIMPTRAHHDDAGLDLYADETFTLQPMQRHLTSTGIAIQLPPGTAGFIHPRFGPAHLSGATVINAPETVDQGYRGKVKINVIHLGAEPLTVEARDRIGHLIIHRFETPELIEVGELEVSDRGETGHGITRT